MMMLQIYETADLEAQLNQHTNLTLLQKCGIILQITLKGVAQI